jgi:hypothetical protein
VPDGPINQRKVRSDKKPAGHKFASPLQIKMRPDGREKMAEQARRAGYGSSGHYLRALATADRAHLGLALYDFNGGLTPDDIALANKPKPKPRKPTATPATQQPPPPPAGA